MKLVLQFMPELEFKKDDLRKFPKDIIADAVDMLRDSDLPPGYEH